VVASGFAIIAAGQVLMLLTLHHGVHNYAGASLPGWILIGIGFGSAVVNSGRQIGGVFGASILVVILGKAEVTGDPSRFYDLWWVAAALCAAAAVSLALTPKRHLPDATAGVPAVAATVPAAAATDGSAA
jgi:hypothetical protein